MLLATVIMHVQLWMSDMWNAGVDPHPNGNDAIPVPYTKPYPNPTRNIRW